MADITTRIPGCDDDCEGERGERGERGKRGHRGHRGHDGHDGRDGDMGPTGPAGTAVNTGATGPTGPTGPIGATGTFDLAESAWAMKWSGSVPGGAGGSTQNLADAGTGATPPGSTPNRYPFCSVHTAMCFAIRVETGSGVGSTVNLLRNGAVFASAPTPAAGTIVIPLAPPEVFAAGDDIEVQVVQPPGFSGFSLEVVVEFQGPVGPTGPTGPSGGPTGPTGGAGPTGPAGSGFSVTPITPAGRSLDTPFVPSLTNNVFCIYTIEFECAAVPGPFGTDITIQLQSDAAPVPTTARCSARFNNIGTDGGLIRTRQVISYIVPPGHSVELATVQNVGGGTVLIVHQTEEIFTPAP